MTRFILAILAITVALATQAKADELGDLIKAKVKAKIAARLGETVDVSGPRTVTNIVTGIGNTGFASADLEIHYDAGDITYAPTTTTTYAPVTTTTSTYAPRHREETTYAPHYTEGSPTYAPRVESRYIEPYCPPAQRYVAPRLTYRAATDECTDVITIRCWAACGGYFVDSEGRRFNLLPSYSKVPPASRHRSLTGRYWRNSSGVLMFTAIWPCGTIRTFIDP